MKVVIEKLFEGVNKNDLMNLLSDPMKFEGIVNGISKVEILSDINKGKGVKWRETRVMFGKEATEDMWISKFDVKDGVMVIEAASHGVEYMTTYSFSDMKVGVSVKMVFEGKPVTLFAKIMTPIAYLFKNTMKKMLLQDLNEIEDFISTDS